MGTFARKAILGALAITVLSTNGCRLGNRTQTATNAGGITYSGYWSTLPTKVTFCVNSTNYCQSYTGDQVLSHVPSEISGIFTNPIALALSSSDKTVGLIQPYSQNGSGLSIRIDANGKLSYSGSTDPVSFWLSNNCYIGMDLAQSGQLTFKADSKAPILGRMSNKVTVSRNFYEVNPGDCVAPLQALEACVNDVNQCGGANSQENIDRHLYAIDLTGAYIGASLITSADLPDVVSFTYEVQYE